MDNTLSTPSPIKSGNYQKNQSLFFNPSKLFVAQITELYDDVWPTVTAIKNLRWQVVGYYTNNGIKDNPSLVRKFVEPSDKTVRPNLARFCLQNDWDDIERNIAKNLLINLFAYYESWIEEMLILLNCDNKKNEKALQFPSEPNKYDYIAFFSSISNNGCQELIDSYYDQYKNSNKNYDYTSVDNWLHYYRYFKEIRNCIVHSGGIAGTKLISEYNIVQGITEQDLNVNELPSLGAVSINNQVNFTLRDSVWFSQILIKLVVTFDTEFIKSNHAEKYFCKEIKRVYKKRKLNPYDTSAIHEMVRSLAGKDFFKRPHYEEKIYELLKKNGVFN